MPGGPELQLLGSKREARRRRIASSTSGARVRGASSNANPRCEVTEEWVGVAIFRQLGRCPIELQDDEP
eukprot:13323896-Alexandrium_andersonii.AAC.1